MCVCVWCVCVCVCIIIIIIIIDNNTLSSLLAYTDIIYSIGIVP